MAPTKLFQKIIVPVDFSPASKQALHTAQGLAQLSGSQLHVFYALQPIVFDAADIATLPLFLPLSKNDVKTAEAHLKKWIQTSNVPYTLKVTMGNPVREIQKRAKQEKADLMVIGNQGKGAFSRIFLGSVSDALVRQAAQDVWVVKGQAKKISNILVPVDGSPQSYETLEHACRLAKLLKAKIFPVSIVEPILQGVMAKIFLPPAGTVFNINQEQKKLVEARKETLTRLMTTQNNVTSASPLLRIGDPKKLLPQLAKEMKADLIVMHRRLANIQQRSLGSIAARVLHQAPCSVLLLRPKDKA